MYFDCGSKLVAAEKELRDAFQGFFKTICLSMEMIKLSEKIAVGEQTLSFLELQIVRFEDGNLIASTEQHPTNPEDGAS